MKKALLLVSGALTLAIAIVIFRPTTLPSTINDSPVRTADSPGNDTLTAAPQADFAADTEKPLLPTTLKADHDASLNAWFDTIGQSGLREHQLAAALLEKDTQARFQRLHALRQYDPYHTLVNMALVDLCLNEHNPLFCDESLYQSLLSFNGDNGIVRDLRALYAHQRGELAEALHEIQEAGRSPYSDDMWTQTLQALGESMSAFGLRERHTDWLEGASGYAAAQVVFHPQELLRMCQQQAQDPQWQTACHRRGLTLAANGRTLLLKGIGLSLARQMSHGDDPVIDSIHEQFQQVNDDLLGNELQSLWEAAAANGFALTDMQWQTWLDIMASEGEIAAARYLSELLAAANTKG